jgi:hypothetical protein
MSQSSVTLVNAGNFTKRHALCKINQARMNYRRARRQKTIKNQKTAAQEKDNKIQGGVPE